MTQLLPTQIDVHHFITLDCGKNLESYVQEKLYKKQVGNWHLHSYIIDFIDSGSGILLVPKRDNRLKWNANLQMSFTNQ